MPIPRKITGTNRVSSTIKTESIQIEKRGGDLLEEIVFDLETENEIEDSDNEEEDVLKRLFSEDTFEFGM